MRRIVLVVLLGAILAPSAWAQVAAPSLLPATPGVTDATISNDPSFLPVNPAVLAWTRVSNTGVGVFRSERDSRATTFPFTVGGTTFTVPVPSSADHYDGTYAGAQLVGSRFAFAVEDLTLRHTEGPGAQSTDSQGVGGSLRISNWLSSGVGYRLTQDEDKDNKRKTDGASLGFSLRLWDAYYLGVVGGNQHEKQHAKTTSGVEIDDTRFLYGYGVGFLNEGPLRLHVEAWAAALPDYTTKDKQKQGAGTVTSAIVELAFRELVVGYTQQTSVSQFESPLFKANGKVTTGEFTLGIASRGAFALLFHYGFAKTNIDGRGIDLHLEANSITRTFSVVYEY